MKKMINKFVVAALSLATLLITGSALAADAISVGTQLTWSNAEYKGMTNYGTGDGGYGPFRLKIPAAVGLPAGSVVTINEIDFAQRSGYGDQKAYLNVGGLGDATKSSDNVEVDTAASLAGMNRIRYKFTTHPIDVVVGTAYTCNAVATADASSGTTMHLHLMTPIAAGADVIFQTNASSAYCVFYEIKATVKSIATEVTPPEPLAVWAGFNETVSGTYTATLGSNTVGADGSVTIGTEGIKFENSEAAWSGQNIGLTIAVKYSNFIKPSALTTFAALNCSASNNTVGGLINTDGKMHGCNGGNDYSSGVGSYTIPPTGVIFVRFKDSNGTSIHMRDGTKLFENSGLKSSTKNWGKQFSIGSLWDGTSKVATGLKIEAVAIFNSRLSDTEIAAYEFPETPFAWSAVNDGAEFTNKSVNLADFGGGLADKQQRGFAFQTFFKGNGTISYTTSSAQLFKTAGTANTITLGTESDGKLYLEVVATGKNPETKRVTTESPVITKAGVHTFVVLVRRGLAGESQTRCVRVFMDGSAILEQVQKDSDADGKFADDTLTTAEFGDSTKADNYFTAYISSTKKAVADVLADGNTMKTLLSGVTTFYPTTWGTIGSEFGGVAYHQDGAFGKSPYTVRFTANDNIINTGIGNEGKVKITSIKLMKRNAGDKVPASITLTQGSTSITSSAKSDGTDLALYGNDRTELAKRGYSQYTFDSEETFDPTQDITVALNTNNGHSVMQARNSVMGSGDWSPVIEFAAVYTYEPVTKATAEITAGTNWSNIGWDDDVEPTAAMAVELTFGGNYTLTLDEEAVGKSFLIKGNSSADQTIKIAGSAANVAAFATKVSLDSTFTGNIEYEFDATASGFTADDALKTSIKAATTKTKYIFKGANNIGVTMDLGDTGNGFATHLVFDGGKHTLRIVNGNHLLSETGSAENPTILVKTGTEVDFTAKDLSGWGNGYNINGVIRVNSGATLNYLQNGNDTCFYRQRLWLDPGSLTTFNYTINGTESRYRWHGGAASGYEQIYVPASDNDQTGNPAIIRQLGVGGLHLASDNTRGLGVFVGANSRLVLDTTITGATTAPLKKFGDGVLEVVGDVSLPTADMFEIVAGKLALGGTVNSLKIDAATEIEVADGKTATITALTGDYAITKTGAGTLNLPASYVNTVTLEGGFLNNDFAGNLKIAYALDLTNVTSFPIGGTVVATGNTGSIKLPASFVDGQIVKFAGETLEGSGLTILDSTGTDITANLEIVDGHIAMVAQEITATLTGANYDWTIIPWDGGKTWKNGLKAILTIDVDADTTVSIGFDYVDDPISASITLKGEGNVAFSCGGMLMCDKIDATELDGEVAITTANVIAVHAKDAIVYNYFGFGSNEVTLDLVSNEGSITVKNTANAKVNINAGASDLTYNYLGNTPIAPSISTTGNFTKEGAGTITGLNFGTDYTGQVTINAGMISSDYLSFGETPHVTIAAGATWQNTHDNVSLQDQARDYSNVTGSGRLEFKSLSTAANAWRAIPVSMDKMWAQSLEFVVSEKDGAILSGATVDYVMGSLSGDCKLRYDFSSGTRSLKVVQSRDTTWNGTFYNSYNERFSTFTVDGTGSDSHVLTLAGTFDNSHPLVVTANGAVKVTGAWQGNVTVNGELGGSGQVKSATEITFVDGATLRADWGALTLNVAPTFGESLNVTLPATQAAAGYKILTLTNAAEKYINVAVTVEGEDVKNYILEQKADGIYLVEKGANGVVIDVPEDEEITKTLATGLNYEKTGLGTLLVKGTIEGTLTISAGEAVIMPGASVGAIVTTGTGKDLYGYTVNINNCGKFAIPSGKTADQIRIFDAVGNSLEITQTDASYVYFDWEITGGACWWDYEFNGNVNNTGTEGTALKWDNDRPGGADFTDDGKLYAVKRPWRDVSTWPSVATFVMYGTMPSNDNRYYVVFGSTTHGSNNAIFLATDKVSEDKVVLCKANGRSGDKDHLINLCTMTVPNAQTAEHLYAFVLKNDDTQTIIDIYLDGELLQSYPFGELINLGTGFQFASPHGGEVAGYARPANDDAALIDWLRVYDGELTKEAHQKYAVLYPYVSPNGSYQRTVTADANWSATDAWTKEGTESAETADAPVAGATAKLTIDNKDATTTIAINLADDVTYEAIQINGDDVKFVLAEGVDFDGIVKSTGRVTADANITFAYVAFSMENAPLTVKQGKTVTFDLSMVDMTQFFSTQTYELTGYLTLEEDAAVTFIVPSELHGRTASAAIDPITRHYVLTITAPDNPFTYTDGAWTWGTQSVTAEIVSANPGTAVTVASGTLEWPMDRASFTVNGGTLKATAAPTAACAIAIEEGGVFDVNGKGSTQYAITLNGGEIANTGDATFVTGLTVTDDSSVNLTSGLSIQSSDGGWNPTTIALGENTLTKTGAGQFTLVATTITGAGTLDIQSGKVYSSESTTFTDGTIKIASGATYQQRGARTTTVAKIIGVDGAILQNNSSDGAGTMSAFTLEGALELAGGSGTFGTITLDEAALDIDTVRGLTVAGDGSIKATITAAEQTSGSFTLFTKATDATIDPVTLVDEAGETLTPSSAVFDENGNYVVAFSVAITAQPREHTYAASVTWGDGTQTAPFVNNVAMIPAGATNVKVQFSLESIEYAFSTGSMTYEVELDEVTGATTVAIPDDIVVGPSIASTGTSLADTKFFPSLASAVASVEDGGTVTMIASDANVATITKSVTIKVGASGQTPNSININATAGTGVTINLASGGTVDGEITVSGGTVNFQTADDNVSGNFIGTLNYSSGTVTRKHDYTVNTPNGYIWYGTGTLTLVYSEFTWIGASGDNWNDSTKWQGGVVPLAGAKAIINLGESAGDYTINLPEDTAALGSLTLSGSATSFAFAGTGSLSATSYDISGLTAATIDLSKTTFNADYTIPANSTLVVNGAVWTSAATFGATTSKIRYDGTYTAIGGTFAGEKGTVEIGGTFTADGNVSLSSNTVMYAFDGAVNVTGNLTVGLDNHSIAYFNRGTINANKLIFGCSVRNTGSSEDYYLGDGTSANGTMVINVNEIGITQANGTGLHVYFRQGCTVNLGAGGIPNNSGSDAFYRNWNLEGGKIAIAASTSVQFRQLRDVTNRTEFEVAANQTLTFRSEPFSNPHQTSGTIVKTGDGSIVFDNDPLVKIEVAGGDATIAAGLESRITVVEGGTLKLKVTDAQWITGYTSTATIPENTNIVFIAPDGTVIPDTTGKVLPRKPASKTWTGATDNNWNVDSNWDPSGVPSATDTVKIESTDGDITITLPTDAVTAVNGATFMGDDDITLTGGAFTPGAFAKLGAGTVTMTLGADIAQAINIIEGTLALEIPTETTRTISGVISGAGALVKTGAGTLTLSGANTYAGGTTVEAGVIVRGNGSAFGASMSTIDVKSGAALNWGDTATRNDNALYRVKLAGVGVGDGNGAFYTTAGNTPLAGGSRHPISLELTADASIGGEQDFGVMYYRNGGYSVATVNLNGYTLTKVGTGTFYTSKIEFSNGTVVVDNGTLNVINNSNDNTNETFQPNAKLVVGENGKLNAFNNSFTVYDVEFKAATNEIENQTKGGKFVVKGTVEGSFSVAKLDFGDGATIKKVGDTVASINVTEALTLIGTINLDVTGKTAEKLPAGTEIDVFTTTNEITVDNIGDIIATSEQNFQPYVKVSEDDTPVYTVGVMATYDAEVTWDGTSGDWTATSFNGIPGNYGDDQQTAIFTDAASGTDAITVTVVEGPRTVKGISFDAARNITINGSVVVNGAITKAGAGRAEVTGTTTVSGAISVTEGTLAINFAADYAQAISVNGVLEVNVPQGVTRTLSGVISGSGKVVKTGAGTLVLSAANTFKGGLEINEGIVKAGNVSGLGSDSSGNAGKGEVRVANGATLDTNGLRLINTIYLIGDGVDGNGAFINNTTDMSGSITTIIHLTGNASWGGSKIFHFGASSNVNLHGYTFTKKGTNAFPVRDTTITGPGKIVVAEGQFNNNAGNNTLQDVDLEVRAGATLNMAGSSLSVRDFTCNGTINGTSATLKVNGTIHGGATIPKLQLFDGSKVALAQGQSITVGNTLTLPAEGTITLDVTGYNTVGDYTVITAPNNYTWDTTKVTLVGNEGWEMYVDGRELKVKLLTLDADISTSEGYNYTGVSIDVDVTRIADGEKAFINLVVKDTDGKPLAAIDRVEITGKGLYQVPVENLTTGADYTYEVTIVDENGDIIEGSKSDDGTVTLGDVQKSNLFSASAETTESVVVNGAWDVTPEIPTIESEFEEEEEVGATKANYYQIADDVTSVFTVNESVESGDLVSIDFEIAFDDGFTTEIDQAEGDAPQAGVTISAEAESATKYWYVCDGGEWTATTTEAIPGAYTVTMEFNYQTKKVRYSVDGIPLTDGSAKVWFDNGNQTATKIATVDFTGDSRLTKFGANAVTIDTNLAANGNTKYATVTDVVNAINAGTSITLLTNVSVDSAALNVGEYTINLDNNKFKWSADVSKFITLKDGKFVVKAITEDDKPKNGVDSYTSYVFNLDAEDPADKPFIKQTGDVKADKLTFKCYHGTKGEPITAISDKATYQIEVATDPAFGTGTLLETSPKAKVNQSIDVDLPFDTTKGRVLYYRAKLIAE